MPLTIEVCLTPKLINQHVLQGKIAIVVDIFRASSCIITALSENSTAIYPVSTVDECLKFPNSRHDDFVDTIAWIGMGLGRLTSPGGYRPKEELPKVGTWGWFKHQTAQQEKQLAMQTSDGF